ncbi:MAG TPA: wax ester/triacylglycerol synthase family O-acyltransferase [Pseudomonadales bacterium]|nr:wax ester/triacylglycerol synthase family O-acyltransferase [Pseudomonadales bacterium]
MTRHPLGLQDAAFLHAETDATPNHIAGLLIFQPPAGRPDFLGELLPGLLAQRPTGFFRRRLQRGLFGIGAQPAMVEAEDVDLDYHVRRIALPQPGSRAQLERVVERIHARRLDLTRPLWEYYFIEGLAQGQVAIYSKMHHAVVDGMAGVTLAMAALSTDAADAATAPWAVEAPTPAPAATESVRARLRALRERGAGVRRLALENTLLGLGRMLDGSRSRFLPFDAPNTAFNQRIDGHRRLATRSIPMDRARAVARATDTTLNDIVLAVTGAALRDWLQTHETLPATSLVAMCPVSVRQGAGTGNNVSMMFGDLATDEASPLARLARVRTSTVRGKQQIGRLSSTAAQDWAGLLALGAVLPVGLGLERRVRPLANLVVSNVPGPRESRFLGGAQLVGYFPISIVTHGQGLNVTVLSRPEAIDFGLTAARSAVADLDRLADALVTAFDALEAAVMDDLEARRRQLPDARDAAPIRRAPRAA